MHHSRLLPLAPAPEAGSRQSHLSIFCPCIGKRFVVRHALRGREKNGGGGGGAGGGGDDGKVKRGVFAGGVVEVLNGRGLVLRMRETIRWLLDVRGSSGTSARE
jgi:hypothetical protein